jgi:hypothetical protein
MPDRFTGTPSSLDVKMYLHRDACGFWHGVACTSEYHDRICQADLMAFARACYEFECDDIDFFVPKHLESEFFEAFELVGELIYQEWSVKNGHV